MSPPDPPATDVSRPAVSRSPERVPRESGARSWIVAFGPIAGIVLVGALLRISQFDQSLFADEMWSYVGATKPSFGGMLDFVRSDEEITPPLFTALAWISAKLADPTSMVRLPSLLAGIALIPLIYALGLRTLGRGVGLTAATLAALSPFLAWYSIEVRAYSLAIALVAASTLCLLIALEGNRTRWWVAFAALSCAAMYTHYTAAYPLLAQLAWVLWFHREARRQVLVSNVAAAVAFIPWVPGLLEDLDSPTQGIIGTLAPLTLDRVIDFTARYAVGHPAAGLQSFWGTWGEVALACGAAVAIAGLVLRLREERPPSEARSERFRAIVLFTMIGLAAPVGIVLVSLVGDSQLLPRNLAASSPGLLLAMAALLTAGSLAFRVISLTLVLGTFAYGAVKNTEAAWQRPGYKDAAAFIDDAAGPEDVVLDVVGLGAGGTDGEPLRPPVFTLDINLDQPHEVIDSVDLPAAERALEEASGNRLFLVGNPFFVAGVGEAIGLGEMVSVEQRDYEGIAPVTVQVFAIPPAAAPDS